MEYTDVAIYRKQERTALVVTMDNKEERPSHKEDNIRYREDPDDLCRRLGLGMGSEFHNPSNRSLDNRREYSIHQCERTYSDLLCPKTPCQNISQPPHQIVHRQYYSSQIQQQVGRHSIQDITRSCGKDSRDMQQLQSRCGIRTNSGTREHTSGLAKPAASYDVKKHDLQCSYAQKNIPTTQSDMGAIDDRCVCGQDEHQITNILEHASGSGSGSHRCLPTNLEETGNVSIPTVEIHTKGVTNDQIAKDTESGSDHSILANTILVSINTENEAHQPPVDVQNRPVEDGCMALIRNKRKNVGDLVAFLRGTSR